MIKKFLSVILCVCVLFSCCVCAFAQDAYPESVPEYIRITDGIFELIRSFFGIFNIKFNYPDCERLCEIPEIEKDYVPQGFCYIESLNMFAVSYYSNKDDNSIISLIYAENGKRFKTVKLLYEDGSPCKAHAGGVADIGDSLIVSSGKAVRRLKLDDVLSSYDYSYVKFSGRMATDMQASYVCSYGNDLFVGQFYSFTPDGTYDTPVEQRIFTSAFGRNYAMCEKYDLSDLDKAFSGEKTEPLMVISMPNSVQGISYDGETFVTSTSYTFNNPSKIRYYNLTQSDYMFNMNGKDLPLYIINEAQAKKTVKVPPMAEGIDFYNGKVTGIFESGAKKFWYSAVRTPYICTFS